ncbi:hypothetical protein [Halopiger aswanensis]|uniref:Multi-ubiquitin domain-containing protein n=1 Tax=Halopiger aswanensis TaxID=148449 RepID=A0A3R7DA65_9EURY|nr:hypothetical protein [Halopiger aswanensis]RKD86231.1 hypothetical protein ATJ93_4648 [Halopiger aswanensis]
MTEDDSTQHARTITDEQPAEDELALQDDPAATDAPDAAERSEEDDTEAAVVTYRLGADEIAVPEGTVAADLKRDHDVPAEAVLTFRDEDAGEIVALNDEDVVTDHVPPGTELQSQPLSGSEVFGRA